MTWKESSIVEERKKFVTDAMSDKIPFSELCTQYGVSRKTGYKWLERFEQDGYSGLFDQSRRPTSKTVQVCEEALAEIVKLKLAHPNWGPKKIRELVARNIGWPKTPSVSSVHRILGRVGLVKKKRVRRVNPEGRIQSRAKPEKANDVWTVDFKGWWMSQDQRKCSPLTIRDESTKFVFRIQKMDSMTAEAVKAVFESTFREYGLPKVIRSDNGTPFASNNGLMGLSRLSVWWLTLGILPDRIDPGKPYQNGGHERMHKDLKAEVQKPLVMTIEESQAALDAWRQEYNEVRPHEALGMKTPSEIYRPSPRKYKPFDELVYSEEFIRRKVTKNGDIKLDSQKVKISTVFFGCHLGLKPTNDYTMQVWLGEFFMGSIDLTTLRFKPEALHVPLSFSQPCLETASELISSGLVVG